MHVICLQVSIQVFVTFLNFDYSKKSFWIDIKALNLKFHCTIISLKRNSMLYEIMVWLLKEEFITKQNYTSSYC